MNGRMIGVKQVLGLVSPPTKSSFYLMPFSNSLLLTNMVELEKGHPRHWGLGITAQVIVIMDISDDYTTPPLDPTNKSTSR